jgi:hypothetical protein
MLVVTSNLSHFERQTFKMKISVFIMLLLSSGAVSDGLENVLKLAEFIADIYQQLEGGCLFLVNPRSRSQGEIEF